MVGFVTPVDIANRALQHVGATRIVTFADDNKQAAETSFCYDKLRRAELRRNVWRFAIRTTALRPLGMDDKLITFGSWNGGTAYAVNDVVTSLVDNHIYYSLIPGNTGNEPSISPGVWTLYFGPVIATEYVTTWGATIAYAIGDHAVGSDGNVYDAIQATTNVNPVGDAGVHWVIGINETPPDNTMATKTSFYAGELVHVGGTVYISLVNNNTVDPTVNSPTSWMTLTTQPTIALLNFIYPIGAGPYSDTQTKNVYRLPSGFLREAPQDPKAGQALFLGAPDGSDFADWNYGGNYFTSSMNGVIAFRFVADIADVTIMDDMFCEGLGCRIGIEVCEILTQSNAKVTTIGAAYKTFMTEARMVNGIETGPIYPPEDSYIVCRY